MVGVGTMNTYEKKEEEKFVWLLVALSPFGVIEILRILGGHFF